ncbi:hypothetical protein Btru_027730 [Bulinus truncatus]|nr:hypothetical protein Btru_027730 [Bulinus truncatus]
MCCKHLDQSSPMNFVLPMNKIGNLPQHVTDRKPATTRHRQETCHNTSQKETCHNTSQIGNLPQLVTDRKPATTRHRQETCHNTTQIGNLP